MLPLFERRFNSPRLAWYLIAPRRRNRRQTPLIYVMAGYAVISTVLRWLISEKMIGAEEPYAGHYHTGRRIYTAIVRYTGRFILIFI